MSADLDRATELDVQRDATKGHNDVSSDTEQTKGMLARLVGRRRFLALGAAGAAVAVGGTGAAAALIRAGGPHPTPRSANPTGLDPLANRNDGAVAPKAVVRYLALAGTDGWATFPSSALVGGANGVGDIDPYFPDPLAEPGNRTTYVFSFRNVTGLDRQTVAGLKGQTQICAPLLHSTVGEELWVTLTNLGLQLRPDLVDGHTLHWHGFRNAIPFYDGVPESSIAVSIGHDFTYVYRPADAGTYMYHCHFEDVEHVTMGMQGVVFVKPSPADRVGLAAGQQKAYGVHDGDPTGETRYDREFAILISEIDTRAHFNDAHIQATDWTDFHADFTTMNGRSYPDTLLPNGRRGADGVLHAQIDQGLAAGVHHLVDAPADTMEDRLASNPLSSLVEAAPGERILIRFVNLGFQNRSIVFPGLSVDVLGRDARYVPKSAQRLATDTIQIGPGESRDVFFTAPDTPGDHPFYDRGLQHYPGNADGTDAWVGGARSAVRVVAGLGAQLKPNGWAGEPWWNGEQALEAMPHVAPVVAAQGYAKNSGPTNQRGKYLKGTVTIDPSTYLSTLQWASATGNTPPNVGSNQWRSLPYAEGGPVTFDARVNPTNTTVRNYWVRAVDGHGLATISARVRF